MQSLPSMVVAFGFLASALPTSAAPNVSQLCEAEKLVAASRFTQCRLKADATFAKTADADRRDTTYNRCASQVSTAYQRAEAKYLGACPSLGDEPSATEYLQQCTDTTAHATHGAGFPKCGNGVVDVVGEQCDGVDHGGETCASIGFLSGTLACDGFCRFDASTCTRTLCGNDIVDAPEQCDEANLGGASCTTLGYTGGILGCTSGCAYDTAACVPAPSVQCGVGTTYDVPSMSCRPDSLVLLIPSAPADYELLFTRGQDSWLAQPQMSSPRNFFSAVAIDGRIYAVGGGPNTIERFDPALGAWSFECIMPYDYSAFVAAGVEGKIYGFGGDGTDFKIRSVTEYDLDTQVWIPRTPPPTIRQQASVVALGGKIYLLGGVNGNNTYSNTLEEYDPLTDQWAVRHPMPTNRSVLAVAASGQRLYAIGGFNGSVLAVVEEYNPQDDTWRSRSPMPAGRYQLAAETINGRIYAIGGGAGGESGRVEEYDPLTDQWSQMSDMPTARRALAAATLNGRLYALGGFGASTILYTSEVYDRGAMYVYRLLQ